MKLSLFASVALSLATLTGCNLIKGKGGSDGGASASGSGAPSLASKALSLMGVGSDAFEGDITMTMTSAGSATPQTIDYEVKGDKLRFDQPSPKGKSGYVIFDSPDKKMYMVDDTAKQAIVIDFSKMDTTAPTAPHAPTGGPATGKPDEDFSIDMSGGDDVVAGYACSIWKVTETNKTSGAITKTDACLAKGIGFPDMSMGMGGKKTWMSKLVTDRFFPLRVITTENGVEKNRMVVTKIDKKTLAASRFDVPAGYKVIDMNDMFKGLGGGKFGGAPPH